MRNIHFKIRQVRLLKNYTQEFVADELNLSIRQYRKIESGEVGLTLARLDQLANLFEIPFDLFTNERDIDIDFSTKKNVEEKIDMSLVHVIQKQEALIREQKAMIEALTSIVVTSKPINENKNM